MMELKKKMVVNVAVLLFLMGFSTSVEAGRLNPSFIISQLFNNGDDARYFPTSSTNECCNTCKCVLYHPNIRMCQCKDVAESCPASCKSCVCTDSIPPQCHCEDAASHRCYVPQCTWASSSNYMWCETKSLRLCFRVWEC